MIKKRTLRASAFAAPCLALLLLMFMAAGARDLLSKIQRDEIGTQKPNPK